MINKYDTSISFDQFKEASEVAGKTAYEASLNAPKLTTSDKIDAFLTDNVTGYTTAKRAYVSDYQPEQYYQDIGFAIEPASVNMLDSKVEVFDKEVARKVLESAKVPTEEWKTFYDSTSMNDFYTNLSKYSDKKHAEELIQSLPMSEQLFGTLVASAVDPVSWVAGAGIGKAVKSVDVASKFVGASAIGLKALENATVAGGAVGISEALLQQENSVNEKDRLLESIGFASTFVSGVSLLPYAIKGSAGLASQAAAATGVNKALTPVSDFIKRSIILNPLDQIMTSKTAPQWIKDLAIKTDTLVFSPRDANGNRIDLRGDHAMGYKRNMEGLELEAYNDINRRANQEGISIAERDALDKKDMNEFTTKVDNEIDRQKMTKSDQELQTIYETETGTLLQSKRGKVQKPEDFDNVVSNYFRREIEANPPKGLEIPKHLEYVYKYFKGMGEEATNIGQHGVAGKSSYGYAPISYDIRAILDRPMVDVVQHFKEMLSANKMVQKELLTAKGAKKQQLLDDLQKAAEGLYQKAIDSDARARYLDITNPTHSASSARLRRYKLDTSLYPEYFSKSMKGDIQTYHDSMVGRFAANKYFGLQTGVQHTKDGTVGISLGDRVEELLKKAVLDGASNKDVANLRALLESVIGTRKIQSDPHSFDSLTSRIGRKFATSLYGAGFAMYSLAELGSIVAKHGVYNTLTQFIPAHKQMLQTIKGLSKDDPLIKYFNDVGLGGMWLKDMKNNRFETGDLVNHGGLVERSLDEVNRIGRKVSFFNQIQDTLDFMAGGAFLSDLRTMSKELNNGGKLTEGMVNRFSRYGLSEADVKAFNNIAEIQYHGKSDIVKDYNFYEWSDRELSKRVLNAMRNSVNETIVRTDGTRVHRWQSDVNGMIKPLLLQYTQFPAAAYERLVLTGGENLGRTAQGVIASMVLTYGMLDLQDAALVQAGVKDVRSSVEDMAIKSFMKSQFSTVLPSMWDMVAAPIAATTTGGYSPSRPELPQSAAVSTAEKVLKGFYKAGKSISDGDYKQAVADFAPTLPLANSLFYAKAGFMSLTGQQIKERGSASGSGSLSSDFLSDSIGTPLTHKHIFGE